MNCADHFAICLPAANAFCAGKCSAAFLTRLRFGSCRITMRLTQITRENVFETTHHLPHDDVA